MTDNELLLAISDIMDQKLEPIHNQLDTLNNRMDNLDKRMDNLENRMDNLENRMDNLEHQVNSLETQVHNLNNQVNSLTSDFQDSKRSITSIELTLENETNHNIQLLAENHMNLIDKLNQAIKAQDKSIIYEVQVSGLKARMDVLEREIKEIKSKIAS